MQGGNIDTLTKSGNIIEDNFFTAINKRYASGSVMRINGCGNIVRNNVVTHAKQNATNGGDQHPFEKALSYFFSFMHCEQILHGVVLLSRKIYSIGVPAC